MKKTLAVVIALMLAFSCASAMAMTLATGGEAGTYYAYGGVLATYINENTDLDITVVSSGGSQANIDLLDLGDAQLATVQNDVAKYAYYGEHDFEGAPVTSFTALAALYTEAVQIVTVDPEIKTVADLAGKTVSIGAPGSGVYYNAVEILEVYGLTEDDINVQRQDFAGSTEELKDGRIDAAFIVAGAPTTAIMDLDAAKSCYLVNLDDEHIAALQEINPTYARTIIPAGTYDHVDSDTLTVGMKATLVANGDISEDEAYAIVSTIFDNTEAIADLHKKGDELDLEYASVCGVPYHAGAAKYFAEHDIEVLTVD